MFYTGLLVQDRDPVISQGPVERKGIFFIESFPQMCFERKWLQNRLRADKNGSRALLAVDIQGNQRGGFCIVPNEKG